MKKLLLFLLTFSLVAILHAATATVNGITWTYQVSNGKAQIYNNSCSAAIPTTISGVITIPSILRGYPVTSIGDDAFYNCKGLTSVTIPEGVTSIGALAFEGCSGLTSVTIPSSVTEIGGGAFCYCDGLTSFVVDSANRHYSVINELLCRRGGNRVIACPGGLTSVTIPSRVTSIGDGAFKGCSALTSVTIPEGVTSIGDHAFYGCSGLTSVTIPEGVTSIESFAFYDCKGLTSVTIPSSVTEIGDYAFSGVAPETLTAAWIPSGMSKAKLKTLTIPEGVTSIESNAFSDCWSLILVMIPSSVTEIESNAFYGCSGLILVMIPSSVTSIESNAFSDCWSLYSIAFSSMPPTQLKNLATVFSRAKGYYFPEYASAWEDVINNGRWNGISVDVLPKRSIGTLTITPISPFGKVIVVYTSDTLKDATILEDFVLSCYDETTGQTYEAQAVKVTKSLSSGSITFEWDMAKDGIQLDAAILRFHVDYFADL